MRTMLLLPLATVVCGATIQDSPTPIHELLERLPEQPSLARSINLRVQRRTLTDAEWTDLILDGGVIKHRRKWPRTVPFAFEVSVPPWLDRTTEIRASMLAPQASTVRAGYTSGGGCALGGDLLRAREPQAPLVIRCGFLTPLPQGADTLALHLEARVGPMKPWSDAALVFTRNVDLPVDLVETVEEAIQPISGTAIDAQVKKSISLKMGYAPWPAEHIGALSVELTRADSPLSDVGFGLIIEFWRDDALVETVEVSPQQTRVWSRERFASWHTVLRRPLSQFTHAELAKWHIRVRGSDRLALLDWGFDKYWSGEFTIPLSATW